MATLTVRSADLSKALSNAESWLPAKSPVPVALVTVEPYGSLSITVTDTYTAGQAYCPIEARDATTSEAVEVTRADLQALAARARKDGAKKAFSRITVETSKGVILHGVTEETGEPVTALAVNGSLRREWAILRDLYELAETHTPWLLINPAYIALFNKIRPDVQGRGVHLVAVPEVGAVFGKVGPHFRGLVMTLDPARNEAALGEGGLW